MHTRQHKTLLIGASGYNCSDDDKQLECCLWTDIANANLRDFDTVILNLLNLDPGSCNWAAFQALLNPKATRDILFNEGTILIIGDPRFSTPYTGQHGVSGHAPFLAWTGIDFTWDGQMGDTMTLSQERRHQRYHEYLKLLRSWSYSLAGCKLPDKSSQTKVYETINVIPLVTNRYRHHVAFEVILAKGRDQYNSYSGTSFVISASGELIFLPQVTGSTDDALKIILREICGLTICSEEPSWIKPLSAPRQIPIDEKILAVSQQIESLQTTLTNLREERTQKRQALKLLYEREFVLEPLVWEILTALGAQIEEPVERNKEDGWITVSSNGTTLEGVLEIKSTKKDHFTEDGRKQLIDWIQRGISQREKKYKGLFIGNSAVDKPHDQRLHPFPGSWTKAAELSEICAFTTSQLYHAFQKDCAGQLDRDLFWKTIFECNGVCSFEGVL